MVSIKFTTKALERIKLQGFLWQISYVMVGCKLTKKKFMKYILGIKSLVINSSTFSLRCFFKQRLSLKCTY